jgi:hypothetical protein
MRFALTILLFCIGLDAMAHEGHQAFYRLYVENGVLTLESKLEIPDLKTALTDADYCSSDQDFNWCAGAWLMDEISVEINGQTRSLNLESSITEDGRLLFAHSLGKTPDPVTSIDISISAFVSSFPDYQNIIPVDIPEHSDGYKLTSKRTSISINISQ